MVAWIYPRLEEVEQIGGPNGRLGFCHDGHGGQHAQAWQ
jgi:hypothetical protein